jgi:hypothetical protein
MDLNHQSFKSDELLLTKSNIVIDQSNIFNLYDNGRYEFILLSRMEHTSNVPSSPLAMLTLKSIDTYYSDDDYDLRDSIHLAKERLQRKHDLNFESVKVDNHAKMTSTDTGTLNSERRHRIGESSFMILKNNSYLSSGSKSN